jgi:hypothetical protein
MAIIVLIKVINEFHVSSEETKGIMPYRIETTPRLCWNEIGILSIKFAINEITIESPIINNINLIRWDNCVVMVIKGMSRAT